MPVTIDPSGRRSVSVDVKVAGTPEEVWDAIATGPGVSSWFVPTTFETGTDGRPQNLVCHFGEGMDANAVVQDWEPPQRFTAKSDDFAPGGPPATTEWTVRPVREGACQVTVEHSIQTEADDWDSFLEGTESGWPAFFTVLRIRMAHFRNEPFATMDLMDKAAAPETAWTDLATALNLTDPTVGEHRTSPEDAPSLAGTVESAPNDSEVMLRIEQPAPGVAHLFALLAGEDTYLSVRFYLYGTQATATAEREQSLWQGWMEKQQLL